MTDLLKKAKTHVVTHKMRYILAALSILVWVNHKKIGKWFGFGDNTTDDDYERVEDVAYNDVNGNTTNVAISDGTRALVNRIKIAYVDSTSYWTWGGERCEIATILDGMSLTQLAATARAYHQATGTMLHAALYGVYSDPCMNTWTNPFRSVESAYDRALKKLENLDIY